MTDDRLVLTETTAGHRYLRNAARLVERLESQEWPRIEAAAAVITDAMARGAAIHAFVTLSHYPSRSGKG